MAPQQSKKRKSELMEEEREGASVAVTIPTDSLARKKMKITQTQKQALIDNLQLEVTERARHLRAHYALQATDLRSRIERRTNRIPVSLRKAKMGDLLAKYIEATISQEMPQIPSLAKALPTVPMIERARPLPSIPRDIPSSSIKPPGSAGPSPAKGTKRCSSPIAILSDKENEPATQPDSLSNPKNPKRTKTATTAATTTAYRATSRTARNGPNSVLSPKSHNSRTLPRSPIKDTNPPPLHSPTKPSYLARSTSPLKPASPLKTAATAATSAISASLHGVVEHAKRGAGTATAGLRRTASKDKAATAANANHKGTMAPPPRPHPTITTAAAAPPDRPTSQVSNHSTTSHSSATSNATTVVTKKKPMGRGKTTATTTAASSAPSTRKATGPTRKATGPPAAAGRKASATRAAGAVGGKVGGNVNANANANAAGVGFGVGVGMANKKVAAAVVVVAEQVAAGRRVLRKRN